MHTLKLILYTYTTTHTTHTYAILCMHILKLILYIHTLQLILHIHMLYYACIY